MKSTIAKLISAATIPSNVAHDQTPVGQYYALRHNQSTAGINYTKLVVADQSRIVKAERLFGKPTVFPSIGSRNDRPSTRRARRNVPIVA